MRFAERARILLLANAGAQDTEIRSRLSLPPKKVARWRNRFLD
ncbi:MAG: helix-turn-helix domain-containing protein [Acidobacteriota bacterium]